MALDPKLLRRIKETWKDVTKIANLSALTRLDLSSALDDDCEIIRLFSFSNFSRKFKTLKYLTALTSLDLTRAGLGYNNPNSCSDWRRGRAARPCTDLSHELPGYSCSAHLCRGLKYLTALTYLNIRESDVDLTLVCKTLKYLTALTHLNVCYETKTADDAARICNAAAAAGLTQLKRLLLGESKCVHGMGNCGEYELSDIVECEAWKQLKLPQPPREILEQCGELTNPFMCFDELAISDFDDKEGIDYVQWLNCAPLVSYLASREKVAYHAIRIFMVGDSTVSPFPARSATAVGLCFIVMYLIACCCRRARRR
jgi:hypothetical protein